MTKAKGSGTQVFRIQGFRFRVKGLQSRGSGWLSGVVFRWSKLYERHLDILWKVLRDL